MKHKSVLLTVGLLPALVMTYGDTMEPVATVPTSSYYLILNSVIVLR